MTVVPAPEPVVVTVLVGLPRVHRDAAGLRGLPVVPFMADVIAASEGWTRVRARSTGELHDLPPAYVLTPIIPLNRPARRDLRGGTTAAPNTKGKERS